MTRDSRTCAIGLEAHSGWAALVGLTGPVAEPSVVLRARLVLADPEDGDAKQPFHAAEDMSFPRAEAFISAAVADAGKRARKELGAALDQLSGKGLRPARCGVLSSSMRPLPDLRSVLASHALIHAAEGDHFRDALALAAEKRGVTVIRVARKQLPSYAEKALGLPARELERRVALFKKSIGAPWGRDQKVAALAAWSLLAAKR